MNPLDYLRPEIRTLQPYSIDHTSARIKMDANESPYDPPEKIMEEISRELRCIQLNRYPDPGTLTLKEKVASYLQCDPGLLMVGNGSDELISYLITAFTGEGNGILFPTPTFAMYGILAKTQGQPVIAVPSDKSFEIDPDLLLKTVREKSPQIVFLASPNNPTGNALPEKTVLQLLEASRTLVVLDEAYIDFSDHPGFQTYLQTYPNLIILRTLSKIGMAALRIGILISSRDVLTELEKVRLPYNINTFSQVAGSVLLEHPEILKEQIHMIRKEREQMFTAMSKLKDMHLFPSQANFILFRIDTSEELYRSLLEAGILIRNLNQPGALQGCLRVTVGRPEENKEFLEHLKRFFQNRN
jgi:histidinol-phosphate aminotransferase